MPRVKLKQTPGGYKIEDEAGHAIAYFYADDDPETARTLALLPRAQVLRYAQAAARAINDLPAEETGAVLGSAAGD